LFAWFAFFAVEIPGLSFYHSRNLLRRLSALDDCGSFRTVGGGLAADDFNGFSTPDPPYVFWRAGKTRMSSEAFNL